MLKENKKGWCHWIEPDKNDWFPHTERVLFSLYVLWAFAFSNNGQYKIVFVRLIWQWTDVKWLFAAIKLIKNGTHLSALHMCIFFLQLTICILTNIEHTEHLGVLCFSLISCFNCMKIFSAPPLKRSISHTKSVIYKMLGLWYCHLVYLASRTYYVNFIFQSFFSFRKDFKKVNNRTVQSRHLQN